MSDPYGWVPECPDSKMDDGSHGAAYEDRGTCEWCHQSAPVELPGFFAARLDEDDSRGSAITKRLAESGWKSEDDAWDMLGPAGIAEWAGMQWGVRLLREVAAKRAILAAWRLAEVAYMLALDAHARDASLDRLVTEAKLDRAAARWATWRDALALTASGWSDHHDYRPEWMPRVEREGAVKE